MSKPYIILRATTLEALEQAVAGHMAAGYAPAGGLFNASAFAPPHSTIAQAMVHRDGEAVAHKAGTGLPPGPKKKPLAKHSDF